MERTEIVVLTVDAEEGVTDQDQRIARMSFTRGKGVVVLLHKWDLIASDKKRTKEVLDHAKRELHFLENPYIVKTSVLGDGRDTGEGRVLGLEALLEACKRTAGSLRKRVTTSDLNGELKAATHAQPAAVVSGASGEAAVHYPGRPVAAVVRDLGQPRSVLGAGVREVPAAMVPQEVDAARRADSGGCSRSWPRWRSQAKLVNPAPKGHEHTTSPGPKGSRRFS